MNIEADIEYLHQKIDAVIVLLKVSIKAVEATLNNDGSNDIYIMLIRQ